MILLSMPLLAGCVLVSRREWYDWRPDDDSGGERESNDTGCVLCESPPCGCASEPSSSSFGLFVASTVLIGLLMLVVRRERARNGDATH